MFGLLAPLAAMAAPIVGGLFGASGASRDARQAQHNQMQSQAERARQAEYANQYLSQIPGVGEQFYNPYIQQGQQAQQLSSQQFNQMSANPMDYINQIVAGYKPSEGYRFREQRGLEAARNSAAQGGLTGTREDQLQRSAMVQGLLGEDMQQWLQNVIGAQQYGLQGQQHFADRGFNASGSLADLIASSLSERAGLGRAREAEAGAEARGYGAQRQAARGAQRQAIGGLISGAPGAISGLGTAFGKLGSAFGGFK